MYIVSVIDIDIKLALNRSSTHCAVAAIASHALDKPRVLCKCASVMRVCVCVSTGFDSRCRSHMCVASAVEIGSSHTHKHVLRRPCPPTDCAALPTTAHCTSLRSS